MAKVTFKVNTQSELWDYGFTEQVGEGWYTLTGNKYYTEYKAEWYEKALEYMNDLDRYGDEAAKFWDELDRATKKALIKIYNECTYCDSIKTILAVLRVLYPEKDYRTTTIRGYCQGDWQELIYAAEDADSVDYLEAWYFGKLAEVECIDGDDNVWGTITDDDLWEAERAGTLKETLLELFGYDEDTECEVFKSDGYVQTTKWVQIA